MKWMYGVRPISILCKNSSGKPAGRPHHGPAAYCLRHYVLYTGRSMAPSPRGPAPPTGESRSGMDRCRANPGPTRIWLIGVRLNAVSGDIPRVDAAIGLVGGGYLKRYALCMVNRYQVFIGLPKAVEYYPAVDQCRCAWPGLQQQLFFGGHDACANSALVRHPDNAVTLCQ